MSILSKGTTFYTGDQVTATKLNNLVDSATFASGAVDNVSVGLSGGALYVKDLGVTTARIAANAVTPDKLSSGAPAWDGSGNVVATGFISGTGFYANNGSGDTTIELGGTGNVFIDLKKPFSDDYDLRILTDGTNSQIESVGQLFINTSYGQNVSISNLAITNATIGGTYIYPLTRANAVLASGTYVDFTSIPSWVKRITVVFDSVSTNGADELLIRIGDSGGIETSGYSSEASDRSANSTSTTGFILTASSTSSSVSNGIVTICNYAGNIWVSSGNISITGIVSSSAGRKELSGTLDRVRITTTGGTNTFDLGVLNILYE